MHNDYLGSSCDYGGTHNGCYHPGNNPGASANVLYRDHYLQRSYVFQSENDVFTEQFRVDSPSWAIVFDVLPLNDDLQYCWFSVNVTNLDTMHTETYGYGRENGYDLKHQIPMYNTGPYKLELRGNRVKVDFTAAKRNP